MGSTGGERRDLKFLIQFSDCHMETIEYYYEHVSGVGSTWLNCSFTMHDSVKEGKTTTLAVKLINLVITPYVRYLDMPQATGSSAVGAAGSGSDTTSGLAS